GRAFCGGRRSAGDGRQPEADGRTRAWLQQRGTPAGAAEYAAGQKGGTKGRRVRGRSGRTARAQAARSFQTGEEVIHGEAKRRQAEEAQAESGPAHVPGRERSDR